MVRDQCIQGCEQVDSNLDNAPENTDGQIAIPELPIYGKQLVSPYVVGISAIIVMIFPIWTLGYDIFTIIENSTLGSAWSIIVSIAYSIIPLVVLVGCFLPAAKAIRRAESVSDWSRCRRMLIRWLIVMVVIVMFDILLQLWIFFYLFANWMGRISDMMLAQFLIMMVIVAVNISQIRLISRLMRDYPGGVRVK